MQNPSRLIGLALVVNLCGLSLTSHAYAQAAQKETPEVENQQNTATASAATVSDKDVVHLKNGGMIRGTISELIPEERVTIVTITGEARTIDMSEVAYAGPASQAPSLEQTTAEPPKEEPPKAVERDEASEPATKDAKRVTLQLEATRPDTTFHVKMGTETGDHAGHVFSVGGGELLPITSQSFSRICTAPCKTEFAEGRYSFGLSDEEDNVAFADEKVTISGPTKLLGRYNNNSSVRTGGWILAIGGPLAGLAIASANIASNVESIDDRVRDESDYTIAWVGLGVGIASLVAGIIMIHVDDSATIDVIK